MSGSNYWTTLLKGRIARRRAMAGATAGALGTAFLAACGGGDDEPAVGTSVLVKPEDTTKQAKRGGVMKDRQFADAPTLDPITANNPWDAIGPLVYSTLVQFKPGYLEPTRNDVMGDLAESWERSPDGLQITMKLRPGVTWHNKAPLNGRPLDADDILFSWNRFSRLNSARTGLVNALNPRAPVISLTATDSRTIAIKLTEPLVFALGLFAAPGPYSGNMLIVPKETDSTVDLRTNMFGTGPWYLSEYTPSVSFVLKRHEGYYEKDRALVDQIDKPIVTEYAAVLSQFKAGNLYHFGSHTTGQVRQEDVLPLKREEPRISVYESDRRGFGGVQKFGWLPEGRSPFTDERVRQAVSMALDRDLYIETFFNISNFEAEGIPLETRWNTALTLDNDGWWLDPKSKDFGPNARYYQQDIAEAKKLLAAAGYPDGFQTLSKAPGVELSYERAPEVIDAMISEIGIKSSHEILQYSHDYIPRYRDGKGQYEGWAFASTAGGTTGQQAIGMLASEYWSKGGSAAFYGFSLSGRNDQSGDPELDAIIEKGRIENDTERLQAIVFDIQRYLAKTAYALQPPGGASTLTVAWPCVRNLRLHQGRHNSYNWGIWIDDSMPPFKSA
jgi:peptide/nickel transport system substrate-binding protein